MSCLATLGANFTRHNCEVRFDNGDKFEGDFLRWFGGATGLTIRTVSLRPVREQPEARLWYLLLG